MDDKARIMELLQVIGRLGHENQQLRATIAAMRGQPRDATIPEYMSGRWHRRSGDVYGISVQSPGVTDANPAATPETDAAMGTP